MNNNPKLSKSVSTYLVIILIVASFTIGLFVGKNQNASEDSNAPLVVSNKNSNKSKDLNFDLFWEVWDKLDKKHIKKPVDEEKMFYGAIKGAVKSLDDPYTSFMDPEETETFQAEMEGSFEGIGAEIGIKNNLLTIVSPLENTPAANAGLRAKDIVLKINDEETLDMSLYQAVSLIRGEKGTEVKLTISREGEDDLLEIPITRDTIDVKSVTSEVIQDDDGQNVGRIKISYFGEETTSEFTKAVSDVLEQNPKGIILDLRNNAGGYLNSSIDIANNFIEKDKLIATEEFSNGDKTEFHAESNPRLNDIPAIVLVNNGSASASEIVAGALRDHGKAKLIGEQTYGKGSVQAYETLKDGSSIRITIAKWLTPNGTDINDTGLEPDINIELTKEDFDNDRDPQLDKALDEL